MRPPAACIRSTARPCGSIAPGWRVIRIFPNRESVVRLLGALLMEQDEAWTTGKRYFEMTAYWQWRSDHAEQEVNHLHTA